MNQTRFFSFPDSVIHLQKTGLFSFIDLHLASFICRLLGQDDSLLALSVALLSRHTVRGNICLDLGLVDSSCMQVLREQGIVLPDRDVWQEKLKASFVVGLPGEQQPLILDGRRLYMKRYFDYERGLATDLIRLAQGRMEGVDFIRLGQGLARYFPEDEGEGAWQKVAAFAAVTRQFCVISGGPGTGKTTTVAKILALIVEQSKGPLRIALAAPTGKAAARLAESLQQARAWIEFPDDFARQIPVQAMTLHRLLGWIPGSPFFRHDRKNPLNLDLLIVDEVSMVDLPLMAKTVQALTPHTRLILLGDRDQLASVEAGAVLGDICGQERLEIFSASFVQAYAETVNSTGVKQPDCFLPKSGSGGCLQDAVVPLCKSYRFGEDSGIKALTSWIRQGDAGRALDVLAQDIPDICWIDTARCKDPKALIETVIEKGFLPAFSTNDVATRYDLLQKFRILSPVREGERGTIQLNAMVRNVLEAKGVFDVHVRWPSGFMVMVTANDYGTGLYNGDIGLTGRDDQDQPRIFFPDQIKGGMRSLALARLPEHEPAFAITVHKSQGSEFDHVLLVLPEKDSPLLTRELLYTALTRARRKITLVCSSDIFIKAVGRRIRRSSGLGELLHKR